MDEAERKRIASRLMALRASRALKAPEPTKPVQERVEKKSKPSPKRTRKRGERTERQRSAAQERIRSRTDLRMVHDAATAAGHVVEAVMDSSRNFAKSRLLIDGELCEIHYVTKATTVKGTLFGRSSYSRASVLAAMPHIVLMDIADYGVLKAYKFPSEYLRRRLFGEPGRMKADLCVPLDKDGFFEPYRLTWSFKRTPPPEA